MDSSEKVVNNCQVSSKAISLGDKGCATVQTETLCMMCAARDSFSIEEAVSRLSDAELAEFEPEEIDNCLWGVIREAGWVIQPSENPVLKRLILFSLCPGCVATVVTDSQVKWAKG